ncbi:helix-turn-helix domain-containing protein [Rhodococcus koreensis]
MGYDTVDSGVEARFGRRVRAERESRGWTQAQLAERLTALGLTLHPSAIAKIELRDVDRPRSIRLEEAEVIARAFDTTVDQMYETESDRVRNLRAQMTAVVERFREVLTEGNALQFSSEVFVAAKSIADDEFDAQLTHFSQLLADIGDLLRDSTGKAVNHGRHS